MIKIIVIIIKKMKIINENENNKWKWQFSSIDIEVIKTIFIIIFFYKRYFKHVKHKQKHLK